MIDSTQSSFRIYHAILLATTLLVSSPSAWCTKDAPETAPSPSAIMPHDSFMMGLEKLKNKSYGILLLAGGINVGILNCLTALISDLLVPYGYSQTDAGNVGIVNVCKDDLCCQMSLYL